MIGSDSGPLISFARTGKFGLLPPLLKKIIVPKAVYDEIVMRGAGKPGAQETATASWIEVIPIKDRARMHDFPSGLGVGEKGAIALASSSADSGIDCHYF